jgi:6-phosphogluconolactonase
MIRNVYEKIHREEDMIIRGSRRECERKAAWVVAEGLRQVLERQDRAVLGVVGGGSVGTVLGHLADEPVDWSRVHLFMVDERLVPLEHPDSNFQLVISFIEHFFDSANLHPYIHDPANGPAAVQRYGQLLVDHGGRFDVVLLSAGSDGHVASLFPGHETILSLDEFFILTDSAPKPPPGRMTSSRTLIGRSETAVLLFLGPEKRPAFLDYLNEQRDVEQCPAKLVKSVSERFVLTDCGVEPL